MLERAKSMWHQLKGWPPGERFERFHHEYTEHWTGWRKLLLVGAAIVSFVIGVILAFIPGPAVVFFALTAALVAVLSHWVAKRFDLAELKVRELVERFKHRHDARRRT
jgi:hypothetical protein